MHVKENIGLTPRTMAEAFGPYTSTNLISGNKTNYGKAWWISLSLISVVGSIVIGVTERYFQ